MGIHRQGLRWASRVRIVTTMMLAVVLGACSSLPSRVDRPISTAVVPDPDSPLAKMVAKAMPWTDDGTGPMRSGFRLLPYGPNSFATRLEMTRQATHTLDVQYYLLQNDNTGRSLMSALRDAAIRGVRVRVLVDDLYTAGEDELLLGLASYPNVEVRLFNPFPGGRGSDLTRIISSGLELGRIDRRMHNKLFIADNVAAVVGGRNMADEYVGNAEGSNFLDMDAFAAGPVVRDLSKAFDTYWNSDTVFPIQSIATSGHSIRELQEQFDRSTANARPAPAYDRRSDPTPAESMPAFLVASMDLPFELARHALTPLSPATARVLVDRLAKTAGLNEREDSLDGTVTGGAMRWFYSARHSLTMISAYFVPSEQGMEALAQARAHKIDIKVVTNSLASTDEPSVHVGYSHYRKSMLKMGVRIYEISPSLTIKRRLGLWGKKAGALHMKCTILDDRQVFLGSMNLDQRSAKLNTELGVIIDSPELAREIVKLTDHSGGAYEVRLGPDGESLEWVATDDAGKQTVVNEEPETSAWQRFELDILAPFIPENEL